MRLPTVVELAKGRAEFQWYCEGTLRYSIAWTEEDCASEHRFAVDIPIGDTGGGQFLPVMKGIAIMRWARKTLELLQESLK